MLHNLTLRQQSIHENYATSSSHPSKVAPIVMENKKKKIFYHRYYTNIFIFLFKKKNFICIQMFKNIHDRSSQDLYEKHSTHMDDSDSDAEQMTSSRIESSNRLNKTKLTSEYPLRYRSLLSDNKHVNFFYLFSIG